MLNKLYIWFLIMQIKVAEASIRRIENLDRPEVNFVEDMIEQVAKYAQETKIQIWGKEFTNIFLVGLYIFYGIIDQIQITLIFFVNDTFDKNYRSDYIWIIMKIKASKELEKVRDK